VEAASRLFFKKKQFVMAQPLVHGLHHRIGVMPQNVFGHPPACDVDVFQGTLATLSKVLDVPPAFVGAYGRWAMDRDGRRYLLASVGAK
jgi:hypothetical protein